MENIDPKYVETAVRSLVVASKIKYGVEVSTNVAYLGGDLVSVIVEGVPDGVIVHDGGVAAERLALSGLKINKDVITRLADLSARYNCAFEDRRVVARSDHATLELAVAMVANASRAVSDYVVELRRHAEADFRAIVTDVLRDVVGSRLRENDEFPGLSGRKYRVSAVILDENQLRPISFIAPVANRSNVAHNFAMLYDLHGGYPSSSQEAIYDEASGLRLEDRALLDTVCNVYPLAEARQKFSAIMETVAGCA